MRRLIFTPRAARDIDAIYDFSAERWGVARAEQYVLELRSRCEALAEGSLTGRSAEDVRSGYSQVRSGSHLVFYRHSPEAVIVMRILHERMDFGRHL